MNPVIPQLEPSKPYFVIISDEGHASIPYKHETYDSAYEESIRLAKIKPEVKFSIFKYIGHTVAKQPEVSHHTYREHPPTQDFWRVAQWRPVGRPLNEPPF